MLMHMCVCVCVHACAQPKTAGSHALASQSFGAAELALGSDWP